MSPEAFADLRDRLVALRVDAFDRFATSDGIDVELLALIGDAAAALPALDTKSVSAKPADRIVLGDNGTAMCLTSYRGAEAVCEVTIDAHVAPHLARQLLGAASTRL